MKTCANCRVDLGLCPACGTFWVRQSGKKYGIYPTEQAEGPTTGYYWLDQLSNVVQR